MLEESKPSESEEVAAATPRNEVPASAESAGETVIDLQAGDTPSVDDLQKRLADLQDAMDQLQSGDLDGAETTIASLEKAMGAGNSTS